MPMYVSSDSYKRFFVTAKASLLITLTCCRVAKNRLLNRFK